MPTQTKKEKAVPCQALPVAPTTPEPASAPPQAEAPSPLPAEPIAQWEDNLGDRVVYALWLVCFALLVLHVFGDTLLGWLFSP